MNLSQRLADWLISVEQKVDVIFLTMDKNLLDGLVELILSIENVNNIVISSALNDEEYIQAGLTRVVKLPAFKNNQRPMVCFLDFADSTSIMGDQRYTYSEKIEWEPLFRRNCISIMTYKYTGSDITAGYWKMTRKLPEIQAQILEISQWGKISQIIPRYEGPVIGGQDIHNAEKSKNWVKSMKEFIEFLIRTLFQNDRGIRIEEIVEFFTSDESLEVLVNAFIHMTQNAIYNYDTIEHHGDNLFRTHFSNYMHFKFKRITPQEASGYQLQYLSSQYQSYWSDDLFLFDRLIRQPFVRDTIKAKTDIMESFFGSLSEIGYRFNPGFNFLVIDKIMNLICESLPFDKDMIFGKAKQKVIQINETLGFDADSIEIKRSDKSTTTSVILTIRVAKPLQEFFLKKDAEISRASAGQGNFHTEKDGLSGINTISFEYSPLKISKNDAENKVWTKISAVYNANNFTFETNRFRDIIFDTIQKYAPEIYEQFKDKIKLDYSIEEHSFDLITFKKSLFENFIIMHFLPTPEGEGYLTTRSMSRYVASSRQINDYEIPYLGKIQNENLSVVPFPSASGTIGGQTVTPLQYGKYQAICLYVSS